MYFFTKRFDEPCTSGTQLLQRQVMQSTLIIRDQNWLVCAFRQEFSSLRACAYRYLGNSADVEDLLHDVLLKILELKPGAIDKVNNPEAFIYSMVKNLCLDKKKRCSSRLELVDSSSVSQFIEMTNDPTAEPEQILITQQKRSVLKKALSELPERCRQAFVLHRLKDMPQKQVAIELGVSLNSIERYIMKAHLHCLTKLRSEEH